MRAAHFEKHSSLQISVPGSVSSMADLTTPTVLSLWTKLDAVNNT